MFCGVEEGEVEVARNFRNGFGGVAEDLGDVCAEAGFFKVFCGEVEAFFEVGFDCPELSFIFRNGFSEPDSGVAV